MITHIVCWKYKSDTSPEQRADHIAKLRALPDIIPNIESFSVGADILHLERSFDIGLVAVYPDMAALDVYTVHPATSGSRGSWQADRGKGCVRGF